MANSSNTQATLEQPSGPHETLAAVPFGAFFVTAAAAAAALSAPGEKAAATPLPLSDDPRRSKRCSKTSDTEAESTDDDSERMSVQFSTDGSSSDEDESSSVVSKWRSVGSRFATALKARPSVSVEEDVDISALAKVGSCYVRCLAELGADGTWEDDFNAEAVEADDDSERTSVEFSIDGSSSDEDESSSVVSKWRSVGSRFATALKASAWESAEEDVDMSALAKVGSSFLRCLTEHGADSPCEGDFSAEAVGAVDVDAWSSVAVRALAALEACDGEISEDGE